VLRWEGGWSDRPDDTPTMHGITLGTYTRWRAAHGWAAPSKAALREITDAEVEAIYRAYYWDAAGCEMLLWPLNLAHFDLAVNAGPGIAAEALRYAGSSFERYMDWREAWYKTLPKFPIFGAGWINRCKDLRKEAAG
jgi:lysozyme family protein